MAIRASFSMHSQAAGHCLRELQVWALVGTSRCCHLGLQRWVWATATAESPTSRSQSLPLSSQQRVQPTDATIAAESPKTRCQLLSPPPQEHVWAMHLNIPYQGDNSQHMLRKETANIQTKSSPQSKNY